MRGEAVGAAGVVGAEEAVDAGGAADLPGGAQDPLAVAPEDVVEDRRVVGHRVAVERDADGPLLAQDGRHVGVEHVVVDGVAAPEHHHRRDAVRPAEVERALPERQAAARRSRPGAARRRREAAGHGRLAGRRRATRPARRQERSRNSLDPGPPARCRSPARAAAPTPRPAEVRAAACPALACTIGQSRGGALAGDPGQVAQQRARRGGRGRARPGRRPGRGTAAWARRRGRCASSMPRLSAAWSRARRARPRRARARGGRWRRRGSSPLSWNSSVSATTPPPAAAAAARPPPPPPGRRRSRNGSGARSGSLRWPGPLVVERAAATPGEAPGLAPDVGVQPVDAALVAGAAAALRRLADEAGPCASTRAARKARQVGGRRAPPAAARPPPAARCRWRPL